MRKTTFDSQLFETSRVLIVDDDITARLLAHKALSSEGFLVVEAEDGVHALEVFQQTLPDIVLMDVEMPRMNGFDACHQLRSLPCGKLVPILMVTGQDDYDSVERAYEVGATDFVTKPMNWRILGQRLRYMLRACAVRSELQQIQKSEARLDNAQRLAGLGGWEWNLMTNDTYWSDQLYRILDLKRGDCSPTLDTFLECVPLEEHLQIRRWIVRSIEAGNSGKSASLNHRIVQPNGKVLSVQHQIEVCFDSSGRSCLIFGTVLDVTQLKEAEAKILAMMDALAESDKLIRASNAELARALAEKRQLLHRIIKTQEYERSYLAQELHDDLGQLLTAVQAEAAVLDAQVGDRESLSASIGAIRSCTAAMYDTVYSRICSLKPLELSNLGLLAALPEMPIIKSLRSLGVKVELNLVDALPIDDDELETSLYRVAQEALSNVTKHAGAKNVRVDLYVLKGTLHMHMYDDGVGYNCQEETEDSADSGMGHPKNSGYGILGMQERVESLGGNFHIGPKINADSTSCAGCQIDIQIPLLQS
ncbi:response regulator [Motiliproteus sp. MSK22-1]|uniref:response regulator n=1 Tax=Motiliproteus sp. MSK22-1 TaxID=1897630 RepID=UPI0009776A14|nr:response regulator [Motiliproteus sp. MSK22-1]OMH32744.1 hypothetical protein BGP75_14560 [Motiliproteus sp. MSK22-1]